MTRNSKLFYLWVTLAFFFCLDFYFSGLIATYVLSKGSLESPLMSVIYVKNTGAAFSLLENATSLLIIISLGALFWILHWTLNNMKRLGPVFIFWTSLLCAGILCNLYERVHYGFVRDFFKLNFINFPVFNISDVFINIGVFAILLLVITKKMYKK